MLLIASHVLVITCCFLKKTQLRELPKNQNLGHKHFSHHSDAGDLFSLGKGAQKAVFLWKYVSARGAL